MDGVTLAKICNVECQKRGISKAQFYSATGVSAASFNGWKNGAQPIENTHFVMCILSTIC